MAKLQLQLSQQAKQISLCGGIVQKINRSFIAAIQAAAMIIKDITDRSSVNTITKAAIDVIITAITEAVIIEVTTKAAGIIAATIEVDITKDHSKAATTVIIAEDLITDALSKTDLITTGAL